MDEDKNIWEDCEQAEKQIKYDESDPKVIIGASLNKLIAILTSVDDYDTKFLHTFITTYQSFTTPYKLFEKLLERYNVPNNVDEKVKNAIRLRVSVVLKYWVGKQFTDLDEDMIAKVYDFVDNTLKNDGYDDLAAMLKKEITSKISERTNMKNAMFAPPPQLKVSWKRNLTHSILLSVLRFME